MKPDSIPPEFDNVRALKETLGDRKLPLIRDMISESGTRPLREFIRTLREVNDMMERGEGAREEPYLAFHTITGDIEALAVGGIFHVYEELVLRDPTFASVVNRGQLVDGLVEILSQQRETKMLYGAIAGENRLNWIKGHPDFSKKFRTSLGFS